MKIAFKGHANRGKEVIQILKMLGGKNIHRIDAIRDCYVYFVMDDKNKTISTLKLNQVLPEQFIIYSLEEFLEKYPYKVGDKVTIEEGSEEYYIISKIIWNGTLIKYDAFCPGQDSCLYNYLAESLQPYKEETNMKTDCKKCGLRYGSVRCFDMDYCPNNQPKSNAVGLKDGEVIECEVKKEPDMVENNYCETLETKVFGYKVGDVIFTNNTGWVKITNKLWDCYAKNYTYEGIGWINNQEYNSISYQDITGKLEMDKVTDKNNCDINCPDGYEFCDDNGNLIGNKIIMRPKKPTYPKTYEECCEVLGISRHDVEIDLPQPYQQKMFNLFKLHICCDAYWKVAGEQMGLGKPWEPDWTNTNSNKYCIYYVGNEIKKQPMLEVRHFLAFPTSEMSDSFLENFGNLIEECKELL